MTGKEQEIINEIGSMLKAHPRGAAAMTNKIKQLYELSIDNVLASPDENAKCTLIGECRAYRDIIEMLQFAQAADTNPSQGFSPAMNPIRSPYDI